MFAAGVLAAGNAMQAIPGLTWEARFVVLVLPWVLLSATGGSLMALVSEILPEGAFVFGRSTLNIAVGVMQIAGYGAAGLLLLAFDTGQLFAGAAAAGVLTVLLVRFGLEDRAPRATGTAVSRSRAVNRLVLGSPVIRPVYLALWVPNGLVVGCEALFVPYGGDQAGFLFSSAAAGMLVGDIGMGRFVPTHLRDRLVEPARLLLAAPYLAFFLHPGLPAACALSLAASVGYCASLPLQERLLTRTAPHIRGHVLGLNSLGMTSMQGLGALVAGAVATLLGADADAAALLDRPHGHRIGGRDVLVGARAASQPERVRARRARTRRSGYVRPRVAVASGALEAMNGTFAQFGVSGRAGPFPPDPRQLFGLFLAVGRILGYGILRTVLSRRSIPATTGRAPSAKAPCTCA